MSTIKTYNYNCLFNFTTSIHAGMNDRQTQANVLQGLQATMAKVAAAKFADGFAAIPNHWFKVNSTIVTMTSFKESAPGPGWWLGIDNYWTYDVTGTVVTNVDTDIADPKQELSPQNWWVIFLGVVAAIALACVGLPMLSVLVLTIVALSATAESLINTTTGALTTVGSNAGSVIVVLGILSVVGLAIYALFFTKTGEKATRKGYQAAKQTYRKARSATRR